MDSLSFTTYLKLCLLPSTQAKTGILQRMHGPSKGYDFYKRMKLAAQEVALGTVAPDDVLAQLSTITKKAERDHNTFVATRFRDWWETQLKAGCFAHKERPSGTFRRDGMPFGIRLKPELRYDAQGVDTVVYLWATATPKLSNQVAGTGILILKEAFSKTAYGKCNFKIFDLRRGKILGDETIANASQTNLTGDLAQISAIWSNIF